MTYHLLSPAVSIVRTVRSFNCILLVFVLVAVQRLPGQETGNTIGVTFHAPGAFEGYTLFGPGGSTHAYLVNIHGELIRRWSSAYLPGMAMYLLENGHLLRCARIGEGFNIGGTGGRVEEFDWDGNLVWSYDYATSLVRQHHDSIKLPNGNVLMVAWEFKTASEALAAGRSLSLLASGNLWPDHLVEIQPSGTTNGTIVWEWHTWDHLIQDRDPARANYGAVGDHPELVDINYPDNPFSDWQHINAVDYNEELDQIILSVHDFNEIWIIDHSTTTQEAAGHTGGRWGKGGDLLYRWGNPCAYRAGTSDDQVLFGQHDTQWIRPGLPGEDHILIFNNGPNRPGVDFSEIHEIIPPVDSNGNYVLEPGAAFGPAAPVWTYSATPRGDFFARNVSGAQRLANGNTLICNGPPGQFFEVTDTGTEVWRYISPVTFEGLLTQGTAPPSQNLTFRAVRYAPDFPGFVGRDLVALGFLELPSVAQFRLVKISRSGSEVTLRWTSEPGTAYALQFRSNLDETTWETVGTITALGTETVFVDADSVRTEQEGGYYRAVRL